MAKFEAGLSSAQSSGMLPEMASNSKKVEDPYLVRLDSLINEFREDRTAGATRFDGIITKLRKSKSLSETQNNLMKQTLEEAVERMDKGTFHMKQFISNTTRVQESEMTLKLASLVPEGKAIVSSYDLKEDKLKVVDIDGMIIGIWEGEEVVIFLEAKSCFSSNSACRDAMSQLGKKRRYWEELTTGYMDNFDPAHGDTGKYQAYSDLQVEEYGNRKVRYAFGGHAFSESAKKYFRKLKMKPICITGDWNAKHVLLDLEV